MSAANPVVTNKDVAAILTTISELLEFKNENHFKIRSYRLAGDTVADLKESIVDLAARGGAAALQELDGIAKGISLQIMEIIERGTSSYLADLTTEVPITVLDLRRLSGIGLKTAQILFNDFGIKTLQELRSFGEGSGLDSVPGIGEKTAQRILRSLARIEKERQADQTVERAEPEAETHQAQ